MTSPIIREASLLLHAHGAAELTDLPEDEFDCCVEEIVELLWNHFQEEAVAALGGAYTSAWVDKVYQDRIRNMKPPV